MSSTITMPPLAAAMTAAEQRAACEALRAMLGSDADIYAQVAVARYTASVACLLVYPNGITRGSSKTFSAPDWPEAFEQARQWAVSYRVIAHDKAIRRMALAIIDLTDQHGKCTAADLRRQGHAVTAELVAAACQRASEMSGNAPFRVEGC